jgi:hypothetical protein
VSEEDRCLKKTEWRDQMFEGVIEESIVVEAYRVSEEDKRTGV